MGCFTDLSEHFAFKDIFLVRICSGVHESFPRGNLYQHIHVVHPHFQNNKIPTYEVGQVFFLYIDEKGLRIIYFFLCWL